MGEAEHVTHGQPNANLHSARPSAKTGASPQEARRPDMLDRKQAAAYIGMSEAWLAHAGDVGPPFIRIGKRRVFYLLADLDSYIQGCHQEPAPCRSTSVPAQLSGGADSKSTDGRFGGRLAREV